jgi:ribonuclease D
METAEKKPDPALVMTREQIMALPLGGFGGRINIINTHGKASWAVHDLSQCRILGFDTETRPAFRKGERHPIALIQLANERHAFLFRVNKTGMHAGLKAVLENPAITKVGQGLEHEIKTLKRELGVNAQGFVDLHQIARKINCEPKSVRGMAAIFLGFRIPKAAQTTNWEMPYLTTKQVRYAATDAWACLEIYRKMEEKGLL